MNKLVITPNDAIARYAIVTLDGQDVTHDCFLADEEKGLVGLFKINEQGKKYIEGDGAAREYKNGVVVISLKDDAPKSVRKHYRQLRAQKHLHIVEPYHSAAMQRMSAPLLEWLPKLYEVTTSAEIDPEADCNLHLPWHTMVGQDRGKSKHIIAYTHCNPPAVRDLLDACERADLITAMSWQGRRELVGMGVDPAKIWVNYAAADQFQFRRRFIAIVGYPQPNGRKREHMLLDMAWQYDLSAYEFLFVGNGWENFANQLASLGVHVQAFHADTFAAINSIFHRIDALLVTGYVEGGPLPLIEAMASGAKVFSPRFGYAADLLEEADLYDDMPDLMQKMDAYFEPCFTNATLARSWTWQDHVSEYALLIGRLLGEPVDLFPERGMSRYAQLLDVIDEVKPMHIVEIGTWSGHNAARMIQAAARYHQIEDVYYQGFDLFELMTGEQFRRELSKHGCNERVVQKKLDATGANIFLKAGDTKDTLQDDVPLDFDLCFVDGGHSEETIQNDADYALGCLRKNNVAIFDDYYHEGKPAGMGCNKVIDGLDRNEFEVTHLPVRTTADDGRVIGMVKVKRSNPRHKGGPVKEGTAYSIGEHNADIRVQMPETTYSGSVTYVYPGLS